MTCENHNCYPENVSVEVRYPLTADQERGDRQLWPELRGTVLEQVGPDEWTVQIDVPELAMHPDGAGARCCFRRATGMLARSGRPSCPAACRQ